MRRGSSSWHTVGRWTFASPMAHVAGSVGGGERADRYDLGCQGGMSAVAALSAKKAL